MINHYWYQTNKFCVIVEISLMKKCHPLYPYLSGILFVYEYT